MFINVAVSCRKDIVHVLGDIASSVDASGWPILKPNTFSETKKSTKSTNNLVCNDTKSIYTNKRFSVERMQPVGSFTLSNFANINKL